MCVGESPKYSYNGYSKLGEASLDRVFEGTCDTIQGGVNFLIFHFKKNTELTGVKKCYYNYHHMWNIISVAGS